MRCGLIGHPVAHSFSPEIHRRFGRQTGIALEYELIDAPPAEFADRVRGFFAAGGRGLNVSLPHKAAALGLADEAGREARRSGVANTLTRLAGGRLRADNTDGTGFVRALTRNLGFDPAERQVLIVGAGGAAAGIIPALLEANAKAIALANRTASRAQGLAKRLADRRVGAVRLRALSTTGAFALVINATSASLQDQRPALPETVIGTNTLACDLLPAEHATPFMAWAASLGARTADGGGMLIEQAAESFSLWHHVRPDAIREPSAEKHARIK